MIGVVGHVDHGKTALVRALTGTDTDRLVEEKRRGISIALGFAHLTRGEASLDLIDMPGHERFVRTMIAGATGIDRVLMVVAANEGVQPQTVEHVEIAGLIGVRSAIVAVTKAELAVPEAATHVAEAAARLLGSANLSVEAVVITSAVKGQGLADLTDALFTTAEGLERLADGLPFLPIDRVFTMAGHGSVVTGTLRGGSVAPGDILELQPGGAAVRVRGAQVHGKAVAQAQPGQRVALNLRGLDRQAISRGATLCAVGTLRPTEWLTVSLRSTPGAPVLANGARLEALVGTTDVAARLRLLDRDTLEPGESAMAQVRLAEPIAAPVGEAAILRLPSPARTVAGGAILETAGRRLRRNDEAVLARLRLLHRHSPADRVSALVEDAGQRGILLDDLTRLSALAPWRIAQLLKGRPFSTGRSGMVVTKAAAAEISAIISAQIAVQPAGCSTSALLSAVPLASPAVLDMVIEQLVQSNRVARRAGRFHSPGSSRDDAGRRDAEAVEAAIIARLKAARLAPPLPRELATDPASTRAIERLVKGGVLVRAVDRAKGKELVFHADAIAEARGRLTPLLTQPPGLMVTEIAAALGLSRKFVMPLLDHLDTIRFTRRVGDHRLLWRAPD